jgi:hypothetical protein
MFYSICQGREYLPSAFNPMWFVRPQCSVVYA